MRFGDAGILGEEGRQRFGRGFCWYCCCFFRRACGSGYGCSCCGGDGSCYGARPGGDNVHGILFFEINAIDGVEIVCEGNGFTVIGADVGLDWLLPGFFVGCRQSVVSQLDREVEFGMVW